MKTKTRKKTYQKVLIFVFFVFQILLLSNQNAMALEIIYPPVPGAEAPQVFLKTCSPSDAFPLYIKYFYHLLVTTSGIVCFGVVLWGGVLYLLSLGSAVKMAEGIGKISAGFLGITIILSSYMLIKTIDPQLLALDISKPDIPAPVFPNILPIEEGVVEYVEIPLGDLIEETAEAAKIAKNQADVVRTKTQEIETKSNVLKGFADDCNCGSIDTENCNCTGGSCSDCTDGICNGDPCVEVRADINRVTLELNTLIDELYLETQKLEIAKQNLEISNKRLKLAEALMRDRGSISGIKNRTSFIGLQEYHENEQDLEVRIKRLWPYDKAIVPIPSEGGIVEFECSGSCNAGATYTPCCILCEDILQCYGNNYKCDENNSSGSELILNGNMELTSSWYDYGTLLINQRSTEQKNEGTYSRKIVASGEDAGIRSNSFQVENGEKYTVHLWIFPIDQASIKIKIRNGNDTGFIYDQKRTGLNLNEWNKISFEVIQSASGDKAYISIHATEAGTWFIDSVSIKKSGSGQCASICESDPKFPESQLGQPPRQGGWPANELGSTIQYNGQTFPVPAGGVQFCDSDDIGCSNPKCEE